MAKIRFDSKTHKYFLDWSENGHRFRIYTGTDKKNASRELDKLNARLLMKKMGFSEPRANDTTLQSKEQPSLPIEEAIQKYLEYSKVHHSPNNYQNTAYILNGSLLSFLKRRKITCIREVTPEIVENYKALRLKGELKFRKISPATINRQVNILKPMFKKLTEWGYLESNSLEKVANLRQVEEEKGRCLSLDECQKLLQASRKCNGGSFYYLAATALGTGMRRGELKNLKTEDVDLKKREIRIVNRGMEARTKTGKNRIIDLSENIVQLLSKHNPHGEYMFDFTNFRKNWKKTKTIASLSCRFHDLRHTFITMCLQRGIQPTSIADWVGHTDLRMIMKIYKHIQRSHLKEEINKLNGLYDDSSA